MAFERNIVREILFILLIGLAVVVTLYVSGIHAWASFSIGISYHSFLAFLSVIATSWAFISYRSNSTLRDAFFITAVSSVALMQISRAIQHILGWISPLHSPATHAGLIELFQLMTVLILLLAGTLDKGERMPKPKRVMLTSIILLSVLMWNWIFSTYFNPLLTQSQIELSCIILGLVSISIGIVTVFLWMMKKEPITSLDTPYLISSIVFLTLATIPILLSEFVSLQLWELGIILQGMGILLFAFATMLPLQKKIGQSKQNSIVILILTSAFVIIPFASSLLVESIVPGLVIIGPGAYLITHIGAAILSIMMAFLIFRYTNIVSTPLSRILILIFATWGIVNLQLVIFWRGEAMILLGESLVPYIVGIIITALLLVQAVSMELSTKSKELEGSIVKWLIYRIPAIIGTIWITEVVEDIIHVLIPTSNTAILGRAVLLIGGVCALFLFLYLAYLVAVKQGSWSTIEGVSIGLLSLWIIPIILKATFTDWLVGWWAAEIIPFVGLLAGPVLIGLLYLNTLAEAKETHSRATLLSDILLHDITNMHQTLRLTLALLEEDISEDERISLLDRANNSIEHLDRIMTSVTRIESATKTGREILEPIDVLDSIKKAHQQLKLEFDDESLPLTIHNNVGECKAIANELLTDLIYNLLKNAYAYTTDPRVIDIQISPIDRHGDYFWKIRISDNGTGIPPERKEKLFMRFMSGAQGIGLGLAVVQALTKSFSGHISVEDRVAGDHTQGTVFIVVLPAYVSHKVDSYNPNL
ncbi:MAG: sensor histidine kinase [Candidatus Thorarchaeota archaeon]